MSKVATIAAAQLRGHEQRPELWAMAAEQGEFVFLTKGLPGTAASAAAADDDVEEERRRLIKERQQLEADREHLGLPLRDGCAEVIAELE